MAAKTKTAQKTPTKRTPAEGVREALAWAERVGAKRIREDMGARFGITTQDKVFGIRMGEIQKFAKGLGRDHDLAAALWEAGAYETRMLAIYVDEPARITPAQMDRWAKAFDNWAVCDTVCFKLFDQTPHAFAKIEAWAKRREEFVKRAAFALLASVAGHIKDAPDAAFLKGLALIEAAAADDRNFVKKGVNWALRSIGNRKSPHLKKAAAACAARLAASSEAAPRWIGKDALREFAKKEGKRT